jgi:hypothetical protein
VLEVTGCCLCHHHTLRLHPLSRCFVLSCTLYIHLGVRLFRSGCGCSALCCRKEGEEGEEERKGWSCCRG